MGYNDWKYSVVLTIYPFVYDNKQGSEKEFLNWRNSYLDYLAANLDSRILN